MNAEEARKITDEVNSLENKLKVIRNKIKSRAEKGYNFINLRFTPDSMLEEEILNILRKDGFFVTKVEDYYSTVYYLTSW